MLAQLASRERWSLLPHRSDDRRALAIELLERLLPARYQANLIYAHDEFPLTASFIRRMGRALNLKITWRRAYELKRQMLDLVVSTGFHKRRGKHGLVIFSLKRKKATAPNTQDNALVTSTHKSRDLLSTKLSCQAPNTGRGPPC